MLIELGELKYAVQNKHHDSTSKSIAMEEEKENATRIYIHNLPQKSDDFVVAYGSSSTRFEHRLVQAASSCAPSVEVPAIFDVKQIECGTPLGWVTVQSSK